ncbi:MAG: quinone oxidoreductase [Gammaproteobacteria bacterium]|nr:quinone oxidoreductase [Gammaproteobacteria bacterium]
MIRSIKVNEFGGPEVMRLITETIAEPGPGQVRVAHSAIGVNFIDTYHRSGLYPLQFPAGLGLEAAGTIAAVGDGVTLLQPGDRVAYATTPPGAYTSERIVAADRVLKLPDSIDETTAAASMLKGFTAWYLLFKSYPVQRGETILIYAAAGGVGLIASQWAQSLGVRVIGVVSTDAKAELARNNGCAEIVMADAPDFVGQVRELTDGKGVAVAYDSVGKDTFIQSLDCLRRHGTMVTYGNASGPVEPFSPLELAARGSLYVTRPVLFDFIADAKGLQEARDALFAALDAGAVTISVNHEYALEDAAEAHIDLEARRTSGSIVLRP